MFSNSSLPLLSLPRSHRTKLWHYPLRWEGYETGHMATASYTCSAIVAGHDAFTHASMFHCTQPGHGTMYLRVSEISSGLFLSSSLGLVLPVQFALHFVLSNIYPCSGKSVPGLFSVLYWHPHLRLLRYAVLPAPDRPTLSPCTIPFHCLRRRPSAAALGVLVYPFVGNVAWYLLGCSATFYSLVRGAPWPCILPLLRRRGCGMELLLPGLTFSFRPIGSQHPKASTTPFPLQRG